MPHHVHLFTYKAGLLSRVAHDLRLHPEHLTVRCEGQQIAVEIEAASLRVDGVMSGGRLDPETLSSRDRAKIVKTIQTEILVARAHPTIRFRGELHGSEGPSPRAQGELTLKGISRPLTIHARRVGARLHARVELQPSHFGIAPYKALAGAIRLQDRVEVELNLDADALGS